MNKSSDSSNEQEQQLIEHFRNLSDEQKDLFLLVLEVAGIMEGERP